MSRLVTTTQSPPAAWRDYLVRQLPRAAKKLRAIESILDRAARAVLRRAMDELAALQAAEKEETA